MVIDESAPKSKRNYLVLLFALGLPCFGFLYCCSGLAWPMWNAKGHLNDRITSQAGISLPASAVVTRAARIAQKDSSEYYEVDLSPDDVQSLVNAFKAKVSGDDVKLAAEPWTLGPTPSWWGVISPGKTERIQLRQDQAVQGFIVDHTPGDRRIRICWYEL